MEVTHQKYGTLASFIKLRQDTFPTTIAAIPKVWLIKGVPEFEEYPTIKLLESPQSGPAKSEYRNFLLAIITTPSEEITFMRLGSYCSNNTHYKLWSIITEDVQRINSGARLGCNGGGVIHANYEDREIVSVSNYGNFGPANPKEIAALLKAGLDAEYKGFKLWLRVQGEDSERDIIV